MKCFSGWIRKYLSYRYCERMLSFRVSPYKRQFLNLRQRYAGRNIESPLGGNGSTTIKEFSSKDTNNEKEAKEDALKDTIKNYYQLRQQLQLLKSQVVEIIGACRQLKSATLPNLKSTLKGQEERKDSLAEGRSWAETAVSDLREQPRFVNFKQSQTGLEKLKNLTPLKEVASRSDSDRPIEIGRDRPKEGEEPGESKIGVDSDKQEPVDIDPYISSEILQQEKIDQLFAPNDRERDNAGFDFKTLDSPPKEPRDPHVELYEKYSTSDREKIQEKLPGKEDFDKKFDEFMKNNPKHRALYEEIVDGGPEKRFFIYDEPYSYYGTNDLISKHHQLGLSNNDLRFNLVQPIFDEDKYYQDNNNNNNNNNDNATSNDNLDPWKSVTETLRENFKEVDLNYTDALSNVKGKEDEKKDEDQEKKKKKKKSAVFHDYHNLAERYDLLKKQMSARDKPKSGSEKPKDMTGLLARQASEQQSNDLKGSVASESTGSGSEQPLDVKGFAASETQPSITGKATSEPGDLDHLKYELIVEKPSEAKISLGKTESLQPSDSSNVTLKSSSENDQKTESKSFNDSEIKEALKLEADLNQTKISSEEASHQTTSQHMDKTPRAATKAVKVEKFGPSDPRKQPPRRPQIAALQKVPNNLFRHNTSYDRQDETTVDEDYVEEEKRKAYEEYLRNSEAEKAALAYKEQLENERYIPDHNSGHSENNLWKDYYKPSKDKK